MTDEMLTAILAERVMGWGVGPDRFMMASRRWQPRWRFQPAESLDDAFKLLEEAALQDYVMGDDGNGFHVRVRIGKTIGEARDKSRSRAITFAVARALGIDVEVDC
jgi:hypothetical protein